MMTMPDRWTNLRLGLAFVSRYIEDARVGCNEADEQMVARALARGNLAWMDALKAFREESDG